MAGWAARRTDRRLTGAFALLTAVVSAVAVALALSGLSPVLDAAGQLASPMLALAGLGAAAAAICLRPRLAGGLLLAAAVLAVELAPQWRSAPVRAAAGVRPVRIYFDNLWVGNGARDDIIGSIRAADADVVALVQVSALNAPYVRTALAGYPYQMTQARERDDVHPGRTLVASRFPLKLAQSDIARWMRYPGFELEVAAPHPFRLAVVHIRRPWPYRQQYDQLHRLALRVLTGAPDRTVVVGDFNATLAGFVMRRLERESGLHALPAAIGDWPSMLPAPFRVAIENALASPGIALTDRRLGRASGSDHLPLVFEVAPAAPPAPPGA